MAEGIGAFVRRRRLALGMTQEVLGELLDMDQNQVSNFELRTRPGKVPSAALVTRLAEVLHCEKTELLAAAGYLDTDEAHTPGMVGDDTLSTRCCLMGSGGRISARDCVSTSARRSGWPGG